MNMHKNEQHLIGDKSIVLKFPCKECDKKFASQNILKVHEDRNHKLKIQKGMSLKNKFYKSDNGDIVCERCPKTFSPSKNRTMFMIQHMQEFHPDSKDKEEFCQTVKNFWGFLETLQ